MRATPAATIAAKAGGCRTKPSVCGRIAPTDGGLGGVGGGKRGCRKTATRQRGNTEGGGARGARVSIIKLSGRVGQRGERTRETIGRPFTVVCALLARAAEAERGETYAARGSFSRNADARVGGSAVIFSAEIARSVGGV